MVIDASLSHRRYKSTEGPIFSHASGKTIGGVETPQVFDEKKIGTRKDSAYSRNEVPKASRSTCSQVTPDARLVGASAKMPTTRTMNRRGSSDRLKMLHKNMDAITSSRTVRGAVGSLGHSGM